MLGEMSLPLTVVESSWDQHLIVDYDRKLVAIVPIDPDSSDDVDEDMKRMAQKATALAGMTNVFGHLVAAMEPFLYLGFSEAELAKRVSPGEFRDILVARRYHRVAMDALR